MLGVMNNRYTLAGSVLINPANAGTLHDKYSINILGGDVFINSNYFYVHKKDYKFSNLFSVDTYKPEYMYIYDYPEFFFKDTINYYDYLKNTSPKDLYFNGRIAGPSVTVRAGNHAFSFVTGFRNNFSAENIPADVANFAFRGQDFAPQHNTPYTHGTFRMAALSWLEVGLGYSYTFFTDRNKEFNAGILVKGLFGTGAAYSVINNVNYMVPNHDSIYFYQMNGTLVLDLPMDYSTNTFSLFNPLILGWGVGFDIGVNYTQKGNPILGEDHTFSKSGDPEENYLFRIGLSLLDVGKINFNKLVQFNEFRNVNNVLWPGLSNFHPRSMQEFVRSASYHLLGDSLASLTEQKSFDMYLPTAVSLQADYYFGKNIFLNATFFEGVRLGQPSVRRPTLLALTPRYETKVFAVNLPVTLYDFRDPALGLAVRVYSLVIGTEKLGTFLNLTDVRGVDFYFSLAININPKNSNWQYKKSKSVRCESYEDYKRYRVK
jgi:hypothetical protein